MRIIDLHRLKDLKTVFQELKVDPYGIKIMLPKAVSYPLRINSISTIAANILKQEMLSLGGDVALPRDVLTGRMKQTDCIILGNISQLNRLNVKLNKQPFGLDRLADQLSFLLANYQKYKFTVELGRYNLYLSKRPYIMGIVNLTPDSFSGDGLYAGSTDRISQTDRIIEHVEKLAQDGADIIDIGGESSRPGATPVGLKEEIARTIPVIKLLSKKIGLPISIDTRKPEVARQALDNGAVLVNDISGLRNKRLSRLVAKYDAGVVIMHMKGTPATMQRKPTYTSLVDNILDYFKSKILQAQENGIAEQKIIIDPGLGFGKTSEHNLQILKSLREFKSLGKPLMVGPSRKSFLGKILQNRPQERVLGTVSSCVVAVQNGANIVRVHDVKEVKEALKVSSAINNI